MKIVEKRESLERCAEAGWYAYDYQLSEPIDKSFILSLRPLGGFTYLPMLKQPFFKIENDHFMIKGMEGNDFLRIAICGEYENMLEELEANLNKE